MYAGDEGVVQIHLVAPALPTSVVLPKHCLTSFVELASDRDELWVGTDFKISVVRFSKNLPMSAMQFRVLREVGIGEWRVRSISLCQGLAGVLFSAGASAESEPAPKRKPDTHRLVLLDRATLKPVSERGIRQTSPFVNTLFKLLPWSLRVTLIVVVFPASNLLTVYCHARGPIEMLLKTECSSGQVHGMFAFAYRDQTAKKRGLLLTGWSYKHKASFIRRIDFVA